MKTVGIVPAIAALSLFGAAAAGAAPVSADAPFDPPDLGAPFMVAQGPGGPPPGGPGPDAPILVMRGPGPGAWWRDSEVVKALGLSEAQTSRIEQAYITHRLRLVDLRADLEKQELRLQPLLDVEQPDEAKVAAQLDLITGARGKLEKEHALMLLAIRRVLSVEQWKRLQAFQQERARAGRGGPAGGPVGPGAPPPLPPRPPR